MSTRWITTFALLVLGFLTGYFAGSPKGQEIPKTGSPPSKEASNHIPQAPLTETPKSQSLDVSSKAISKPETKHTQLEITAPLYSVFLEGEVFAEFDQLEEEQDLPAIVDMILGLIQQRRFSEADRLIDSTIAGMNGGKLNSPLWKNSASPEFYVLRFCQYPTNYQATLEYALHVYQLTNPPELLGDLRDEIFQDDRMIRLLGMNDGSADHLVADFVPIYRDHIESWSRTLFTKRSVIQGLGLIPTEEAALLIADLKDWTPSKLELDLIQALSTNGTPMAIEIMTTWLSEERNPRFKLALEDALRLSN